MVGLPDKIVSLHRSLDAAGIGHAFGGALALAWCTERARGTIDIDVNVFVPPESASAVERVLDAFPDGVMRSDADVEVLRRDGQARLWWGRTPIDVFFDTTDFHRSVAMRARVELFAGAEVPFLSCSDLAVFKAFFNRTRDWADLEEMAAVGTLDVDRVLGVLTHYLGGGDERVSRLRSLVT